MTTDLFGGLLKGLENFMPLDNPDTLIFTAGNELTDLQSQKTELYARIGEKASTIYPNEASYASEMEELKIITRKIEAVIQKIEQAKADKSAQDQQNSAFLCSSCGFSNPPDTKFCQECGSKLTGTVAIICTNCGSENKSGVKFCGECGTQL